MALFETTFPPYVPFGSRNLSLQTPNLRGTDVAVFQSVYDLMLKSMNPPLGPIGQPIAIDGVFGANARQAAINIQSYFGLATDGVVGPDTFFVFGQGSRSHTTYGGPDYGSRTLSQGMSGGDVTVLQNRLNNFRYASIIGHPANGFFDAATATAVLAFKQDAIANGDTGLELNSTVGSGTFDATWIYTFAGGRGILPGRNGFDVVFLQTLLNQLGYYSGAIQGYYDGPTQAAVRAFQRAHGITVDGQVGQTTFYRLGLQNSVPAPQPLGIAWPPSSPPAVTACSVALTPTSVAPNVYGVAALVTDGTRASLDVIGNNLPAPSSFGSTFGQYAFTMTDPSSGLVVAQNLMVLVTPPFGKDWGGSAFLTPPGVKGTVTVYPTPPGAFGPYGPAVLTGNLANCC